MYCLFLEPFLEKTCMHLLFQEKSLTKDLLHPSKKPVGKIVDIRMIEHYFNKIFQYEMVKNNEM